MGALNKDTNAVSAPGVQEAASRGDNVAHFSAQEALEQQTAALELDDRRSMWRARRAQWRATFCKVVCSPSGWQQKLLCLLWWLLVVAAVIALFVVLLPRALAGPIQQLVALLTRKLKPKQLVAIIIAAVALLPCTIILGGAMMPFIWIAGMAFDFGPAFAMVMAGSIIGMSAQYWVARYLFKEKAERYLLQRRKDGLTVALRAVELAGPWKVVALVRLGPSPYAVMNYVFGTCPTIRYHHFIIASTLCTAHHRALSVFFGRAMPTLADLFMGKPVKDVGAAVYRVVLLVLGIVLCVAIVILAKRALKKLQEQELEREAAEAAAAEAEAIEEGGAGLGAEPAAAGAAAAAAAGAGGAVCAAGAAGRAAALPAAIGSKLAGADGQGSSLSLDGSDGGDLIIVVDNNNSSSAAGTPPSLGSSSSLSSAGSSSGQAPSGPEQPVPAPAAATAADSNSGADGGPGARVSSVSSLRSMLSARFQRSS